MAPFLVLLTRSYVWQTGMRGFWQNFWAVPLFKFYSGDVAFMPDQHAAVTACWSNTFSNTFQSSMYAWEVCVECGRIQTALKLSGLGFQ
jgi:hypothetical protein